MTSLREAAALVGEMAKGSSPSGHLGEFANAVHRLDVRLEAIESVIAALIEKTGLMYEETVSPEPQGFEQPPDQQKARPRCFCKYSASLRAKPNGCVAAIRHAARFRRDVERKGTG
jgi:hypothetical protein